MWCCKHIVVRAHDDFITDKGSSLICNRSNVSTFSSSLTNPRFRFQPMMADWPRWGSVNIPALIPFSHSGPKAARRPDWTAVQCIWFANPNVVPNIGIAECRRFLSSDSQYVGDPSSPPHDEPHRYRTTKAVVGFSEVCDTFGFLWGNMFVSQNEQNAVGVCFGKDQLQHVLE